MAKSLMDAAKGLAVGVLCSIPFPGLMPLAGIAGGLMGASGLKRLSPIR